MEGRMGENTCMDSSSLKRLLLDRITSISNKVSSMKQQLQEALEIVRSKNEKIAVLNQKLSNAQVVGNESNPPVKEKSQADTNTVKDARQSNETKLLEHQQLTKKLKAMQQFFKEYGIDIKGRNPNKKTTQKKQILYSPNFDRIITVIEELNDNVSSESRIVRIDNEAMFKKADLLNLTLYADGMQLENNSFRKYESHSVKEFFNDLEDGYYPMELKGRHPDGVIFKLVDKRKFNYAETLKSEYPGEGNTLGGDRRKSTGGKGVKLDEVQETKVKAPADDASKARKRPLRTRESAEVLSAMDESKKSTPPPPLLVGELKTFFISDKSPAQSELIYDKMNARESVSGDIVSLPSVPKKIASISGDVKKTKIAGSGGKKSFVTSVKETAVQTSVQNVAAVPKRDGQNLGPTNITNITYNEAPLKINITPKASRTSTCSRCQKHTRKTKCFSSPNQESLCACKKDESYSRAPRQLQPVVQKPTKMKVVDEKPTSQSPWVTEYKEQFCLNAEKRFKESKEIKSKEKSFPKKLPVENRKFPNFTFFGKNKEEGGNNEEEIVEREDHIDSDGKPKTTSSRKRKKVVTLNKKTSDRMMSLTISLADGSVEYIANLYPEDTVKNLWSLLNLRERDYYLSVRGAEDTKIENGETAKELKGRPTLVLIRVDDKIKETVSQSGIRESHALSKSSLIATGQTLGIVADSKENIPAYASEQSAASVKSEQLEPKGHISGSKKIVGDLDQKEIQSYSPKVISKSESPEELGRISASRKHSVSETQPEINGEPNGDGFLGKRLEKYTLGKPKDEKEMLPAPKKGSKSSLTLGKKSPPAGLRNSIDAKDVESPTSKKSLSIPDEKVNLLNQKGDARSVSKELSTSPVEDGALREVLDPTDQNTIKSLTSKHSIISDIGESVAVEAFHESEITEKEKSDSGEQKFISDPKNISGIPEITEAGDQRETTGKPTDIYSHVENRGDAVDKEGTLTSLISQTTFENKNRMKPEIEPSAAEVPALA